MQWIIREVSWGRRMTQRLAHLLLHCLLFLPVPFSSVGSLGGIVLLCGTVWLCVDYSFLYRFDPLSLGLNVLEQREKYVPSKMLNLWFPCSFQHFCSFSRHSVHALFETKNTFNFIVFITYIDKRSIRGHYLYLNVALNEYNVWSDQNPQLKLFWSSSKTQVSQ